MGRHGPYHLRLCLDLLRLASLPREQLPRLLLLLLLYGSEERATGAGPSQALSSRPNAVSRPHLTEPNQVQGPL